MGNRQPPMTSSAPRTGLLLIFAAIAFTTAGALSAADAESSLKKVDICVLWSPQCGHCEPVEEKALEKLSREVGFKVEPRYIDIDKMENYAKLVEIEKLMGVKSQDLPVVLIGSQLIGGEKAIRKDLRAAVERVHATGERRPEAVDEVLRSGASPQVQAEATAKVYGSYFTLAACMHCRRPDHVVKYLKATIPNLELRTLDKQDVETRVLQEALEEHAGVPADGRGKRPVLVVGSRTLINEEITDSAAVELVRGAVDAGLPPWNLSEADRAAAKDRLVKRLSRLTLGAMAVGGFLDGINPCAFAVIVFFVSYLATLGSTRRQLLAIGLSFILAVFLTYFSIGLGLSEVIGMLSQAPWLARALSFAIAGVALVLALLSFYDFVLAARGRPREIVLQLPSALKRRINLTLARRVGGAYREAGKGAGNPASPTGGGRSAFFFVAVAAFVSGVIVSFLELACTGQIYLPAIRMMLFDVSGLWLKAVFYLLVYNLAFVVPLLGIFVLAYMGVTSEQLRGWLTRHMGVTKLAMGVFFAALGVIILIIEL